MSGLVLVLTVVRPSLVGRERPSRWERSGPASDAGRRHIVWGSFVLHKTDQMEGM